MVFCRQFPHLSCSEKDEQILVRATRFWSEEKEVQTTKHIWVEIRSSGPIATFTTSITTFKNDQWTESAGWRRNAPFLMNENEWLLRLLSAATFTHRLTFKTALGTLTYHKSRMVFVSRVLRHWGRQRGINEAVLEPCPNCLIKSHPILVLEPRLFGEGKLNLLTPKVCLHMEMSSFPGENALLLVLLALDSLSVFLSVADQL